MLRSLRTLTLAAAALALLRLAGCETYDDTNDMDNGYHGEESPSEMTPDVDR